MMACPAELCDSLLLDTSFVHAANAMTVMMACIAELCFKRIANHGIGTDSTKHLEIRDAAVMLTSACEQPLCCCPRVPAGAPFNAAGLPHRPSQARQTSQLSHGVRFTGAPPPAPIVLHNA